MPRVLIVEDDTLIGMSLAALLQDSGFDVCDVETTQEGAVAAALRLRPDLMIVDAQLARGSGPAAMAEIARHCTMRHIYISGARLTAEAFGAPVLRKPFTEQELVRAVHGALAQ